MQINLFVYRSHFRVANELFVAERLIARHRRRVASSTGIIRSSDVDYLVPVPGLYHTCDVDYLVLDIYVRKEVDSYPANIAR